MLGERVLSGKSGSHSIKQIYILITNPPFTLVMGSSVFVWSDVVTECPGHVTTTTELIRRDTSSRETFRLTPTRSFQVYTTRPGDACARRQSIAVENPTLKFSYRGNHYPVSCAVVSTVRRLWCNLTVITGEGEVVALSHGNTNISIPSFVWRGAGDGGNGTITATCRCTCQLSRGAGPTRTAELSHSVVQDKQPVVNPTQYVTMGNESSTLLKLTKSLSSRFSKLSYQDFWMRYQTNLQSLGIREDPQTVFLIVPVGSCRKRYPDRTSSSRRTTQK
eukprot:sb/3467988/